MERTLEDFVKIKGSKSLTSYQMAIFRIKDLRSGWFNRYKDNEVTSEEWAAAFDSLEMSKGVIKGFKVPSGEQKLYLMMSEFNIYKIGISSNINRRKSQLRSASGCDIDVIGIWNCGTSKRTRHIEKLLHIAFSSYRKSGEWFDFKGQDGLILINKFFTNFSEFKIKKVNS